MSKINHVLILAAGRGNRMRPLTDVVPKALAPFRGTTLIERTIENFHRHQIQLHVTVGHLGNVLAEVLLKKKLSSTLINTSGHDNAWWIFNSLMKFINEPVLVLTCDNVTDLDLNFIELEYIRLNSPACMLVPVSPIDGIDGDYIFATSSGEVKELSRLKNTNIYASGIQVINPMKVNSILDEFENFNDVWMGLIKNQQLFTSRTYENKWFSIDTLEQLILKENE